MRAPLTVSDFHNHGDCPGARSGYRPSRAGGRRLQFAVKRLLDLLLAAMGLVVLLPLLLALAALIRLESPGSPVFTQKRWGRNGRVFKVYKFRSMHSELGDRSGITQTVPNDPRVTRVGAVIRRTNLDELPQLLNVLKGDMSLIGPRCHAVRPGMTGLAQMRGLRGPTDRADRARARIAADLYYVENYSLLLDLHIAAGTIVSELRGGNGF